METFDVVIVGAGAAGLFCAGRAGPLGQRVLLLDPSPKVAEKIRISGGGRANFTNRDVTPANFLSDNPRFCRSALARFTPGDFIELVQRHGIAFHEKHGANSPINIIPDELAFRLYPFLKNAYVKTADLESTARSYTGDVSGATLPKSNGLGGLDDISTVVLDVNGKLVKIRRKDRAPCEHGLMLKKVQAVSLSLWALRDICHEAFLS